MDDQRLAELMAEANAIVNSGPSSSNWNLAESSIQNTASKPQTTTQLKKPTRVKKTGQQPRKPPQKSAEVQKSSKYRKSIRGMMLMIS